MRVKLEDIDAASTTRATQTPQFPPGPDLEATQYCDINDFHRSKLAASDTTLSVYMQRYAKLEHQDDKGVFGGRISVLRTRFALLFGTGAVESTQQDASHASIS